MLPAPVEVAPGIHRVSVPLPFPPHEVAAWVIEGSDGHTLVDTGLDTPVARGALRAGAERLGVTPSSLVRVVLTHVHIDHYGLAGPVRAWSGAPVALHEREEQLVRRFVDSWPEDRPRAEAELRSQGVPEEVVPELMRASDHLHRMYPDFRPDELLAGPSGAFAGGGGWEWILTPGHSPGHITVYHPDRRVLIAGDHVLPRISPNIGADLYVDDPLSDYLASLHRLRELPVDLVLPSHGEPFAGLARRIDDIVRHHGGRNAQLLEALDLPRTGFELTRRLFPSLAPESLLHALREVRAHLIHLEHRGEVARVVRASAELWRRG